VDNARVSGVQARKIADMFSGGDGIPDWWRLAYFDHATGLAGDNSRASDDADGDGATNLNEYLAATNPLSTNSVFRISAFSHAGSSNAVLWTTVASRSYQLQQRDALSGTNLWIDVGPLRAGTGGVITQSVIGSVTARFFRVRAQ
jgi:hypothetical protein